MDFFNVNRTPRPEKIFAAPDDSNGFDPEPSLNGMPQGV
jgi:hypothetical protein